MKKIFLFLLLSLMGLTAFEQSITDVKLRSDENGRGKLKKAPRKIFIAEFRVMYQLLYVAEDTKKGSVFDGGMTGDVTVALAMGLQGITENDLVQNTNHLYSSFTQRMKDAGYEMVTADAMAGIKEFKDWERKKGGGLSDAQFKGFVMSTPTDFEYFVKGTRADGREKKTFTDNSAKISYQGDNITVVKVNLVIPIAENGESWASGAFKLGGAKVVAETALKLSDEMITGKGFGNGISTMANFVNSEAMSLPTSLCYYSLKKPVEINEVLEKKKFKVTGASDYDWSGTQTGVYRVFTVQNQFMKKVIPLPVDAAKYNAGVRLAGDAFLKEAWDSFAGNAN